MQSHLRHSLSIAAAALAVAVLAGCGGSSSSNSGSSTSSSQPGKGKPPITLGDKNFTEEYTIGDMYAQALRAKGFTVNLKPNIGSSELIDKSLRSGQIDMYPEYTGVILSVIKGQTKVPPTAHATYVQAKKFEESRGFTLLAPTPFQDRDVTATLVSFAKKHGLKSMQDLSKLKSFTNGGPPENKTRYEGIVGMHEAYHLHNVVFVPLAIGLQYSALDSGKVDTANVFTTDGQLQSGHYTLLADPKHIYGFQNVAPVVSTKLLKKEGPAFAQTLNAVNAKLTTHVMQQLNAAVDLNKISSTTVSQRFLKANGLL
jgi:osmoprotectant transport system substrate-binding protein